MPEPSSSQYKIPFLIGVVGHPDRVAEEIPFFRAAVARVLERLREENPDVPLRLLCSMAAGADLLVADVAAAIGIEIVALLPYTRALCRNDLESEPERRNFDRLCDMSDVVELSLPDDPNVPDVESSSETRDRQLQRAGALIARYSGLMIAVWNGLDTDHRAGTARAIEFRRRGVIPSGDVQVLPRDALLSPQSDDLNFEVRCSRLSRPSPAGVTVLGFTGSQASGGEQIPRPLRTTFGRMAEFNRDVDSFSEQIAGKERRLSQPSPTPIPATLQYLDRLFAAADWLGSYHRRCFTLALRSRYLLWALMAFLLIAFKKDSVGTAAITEIVGVLLVFLSRERCSRSGRIGAPATANISTNERWPRPSASTFIGSSPACARSSTESLPTKASCKSRTWSYGVDPQRHARGDLRLRSIRAGASARASPSPMLIGSAMRRAALDRCPTTVSGCTGSRTRCTARSASTGCCCSAASCSRSHSRSMWA